MLPGRDVPERYGSWRTVASRFYRWRRAGIWQRLFEAVQQQADAAGQLDWAIHYVDGTIVRAHQHAAGSPKGAEAEAIRITIPHKENEHRSGPFDRAIYRLRERVERLINRLKQNRRIATRYDRCAENYRAMWLIAATLLWL